MIKTVKKSCLIIDDDEATLNVLRRFVKQSGVSDVVTSLNASQGLRIIESGPKPFDLIISDQVMPGMSGIEFFEQAIKLAPESRRIIITGHMDFQLTMDALNKGFIHLLVRKPWDHDDLLEKMAYELRIFEKETLSRAYIRTIRRQNESLVKTAQQLRRVETETRHVLVKKQEKIKALKQKLRKAREEALPEKGVFQLYQLLAKNIVINGENLRPAFKILREQIEVLFDRIAEDNKLLAPGRSVGRENLEQAVKEAVIPQDDFQGIDRFLHYAGKIIEPDLFAMGRNNLKEFSIHRGALPLRLEDLALSEGMVTKEEIQALGGEFENRENRSHRKTGKILLKKGLISRLELTKLLTKIHFIETRARDMRIAGLLLQEKSVTRDQIDHALLQQINLYFETGSCPSITDLMLIEEVIDAAAKERFSTAPEERKEAVEPDGSGVCKKITLCVPADNMLASISIPDGCKKSVTVNDVKMFLESKEICSGIVPEQIIQNYLSFSKVPFQGFIVARGKKPVPGKNTKIKYYFNADYQQPGIIREDGSIDFKNRGTAPWVKEGELLAEKLPSREGVPGTDVYGRTIPPEPVADIELKAREGVWISEDGLKAYSEIEGQAGLGPDGSISVYKEIVIKGDVNFKTGNIDHNGNVIVTGIIREGFSVRCVDLTVESIVGGVVDAAGNVFVSGGIIDSTVFSQGRLHAKHIKSSCVSALGDIKVGKEIMDSKVVSGGCIGNGFGKITGSELSAKIGLTLGQVGTLKAKNSRIKMGFDEHLDTISTKYREQISGKKKQKHALEKAKKSLEEKLLQLQRHAVTCSDSQEKKQREIQKIKEDIPALKDDPGAKRRKTEALKKLVQQMNKSDRLIDYLFRSQDALMKDIDQKELEITALGNEIQQINGELCAVTIRLKDKPPPPVLTINKTVFPAGKIITPSASLIIKHDTGPCSIIEVDAGAPGTACRELAIVERIIRR